MLQNGIVRIIECSDNRMFERCSIGIMGVLLQAGVRAGLKLFWPERVKQRVLYGDTIGFVENLRYSN